VTLRPDVTLLVAGLVLGPLGGLDLLAHLGPKSTARDGTEPEVLGTEVLDEVFDIELPIDLTPSFIGLVKTVIDVVPEEVIQADLVFFQIPLILPFVVLGFPRSQAEFRHLGILPQIFLVVQNVILVVLLDRTLSRTEGHHLGELGTPGRVTHAVLVKDEDRLPTHHAVVDVRSDHAPSGAVTVQAGELRKEAIPVTTDLRGKPAVDGLHTGTVTHLVFASDRAVLCPTLDADTIVHISPQEGVDVLAHGGSLGATGALHKPSVLGDGTAVKKGGKLLTRAHSYAPYVR